MTTTLSRPLSLGLSLALTVALLYLGCALVLALAPGAMVAGLGLIVHGFSLSGLSPAPGGLSWSGVLKGTAVIAGYAFIAGVLFGVVHRWIGGVR